MTFKNYSHLNLNLVLWAWNIYRQFSAIHQFSSIRLCTMLSTLKMLRLILSTLWCWPMSPLAMEYGDNFINRKNKKKGNTSTKNTLMLRRIYFVSPICTKDKKKIKMIIDIYVFLSNKLFNNYLKINKKNKIIYFFLKKRKLSIIPFDLRMELIH